ncbi:MAG: hypothetical protein GVY33_12185 [Alphaproteobacteria bacterium]|jgi:hypothetical protein|nr:hypothetical protein [Alphaproteobacteria bacterium]
MVATKDVDIELPIHVEGAVRELGWAATVCRGGAHALKAAPARDIVAALAGIHERDLGHLRRLAEQLGVAAEAPARDAEAEALGRIRLARERDGDAGVLDIVREAERRATRIYDQLKSDDRLPAEFRTLVTSAREELQRRHRRLDAAMRVAA